MPKITLSLKSPGKILVSENQEVSVGEVLAENERFFTATINLAQELKVDPKQVSKYLVKKIGDQISQGQVLVVKKGLFEKQTIRAKVSGIIKSLDQDTGLLTVITKSEMNRLLSPLKATVVKIENEKVITLEFKAEIFEGKEARGKKLGVIKIISKEKGPVSMFDIKGVDENSLLVGYSWSRESLNKADALDATVIGVKFESSPDKKAGGLDSEGTSFIILGNDSFLRLCELEGKSALLSGSERRLYVQDD
ncbi:hypothetical protein HY345_00365 [Candidatus Microgenomates bacterium]|nr:hypothetical protein [Candidatus Microgenomates bacterium]